MQKPSIIFFGNTKYSILGAQIINTVYGLSGVITISDRTIGRDKEKIASPVKIVAQKLSVPVIEANILTEEIIKKISELKPDFLVVEDYGLILPESLLKLPKFAALNIHQSLLPKYRGVSPAPSAILAGEKISGVTIIKMSKNVDAGDILAQKKYVLKSDETTDSLLTELNVTGGQLAIEVIKQYLEDTFKLQKQDDTKATFTKFIKKEDGYFDINNCPAKDRLDAMIRAYYPWPTAWTKWNGKIVKFLPNGLVQMEGKKAVKLKDFLNGYPDFPIKDL